MDIWSHAKHTHTHRIMCVCVCVCVYNILLYMYIYSFLFGGSITNRTTVNSLYQSISFISLVNKCTHLEVELLNNGEHFYIAYKYVLFSENIINQCLHHFDTHQHCMRMVFTFSQVITRSQRTASTEVKFWHQKQLSLAATLSLNSFIFACLDFPSKFWNIEGNQNNLIFSQYSIILDI